MKNKNKIMKYKNKMLKNIKWIIINSVEKLLNPDVFLANLELE